MLEPPASANQASYSTVAPGSNPASKRWPRKLNMQVILRISLSGILLALVCWKLDFAALGRVLANIRFGFLAAMFVSMMWERFYAAYRWYVLVKPKDPSVSYEQLLRIIFASSLLGLFLPGGSTETLRVVGQARNSNDLAHAFSSVFVDRYVGLFTLALITLIATWLSAIPINPTVTLWAWSMTVAMATFHFAAPGRWAQKLASMMLAPKWCAGIRVKYEKLRANLATMQSNHPLMVKVLVLAFGIQLLRIASVVLGGLALGIDLPLIYYLAFVPIIIFVQLLPISIAGFGTREAAYIFLLGTVGIQSEVAFGLSLLTYFVTLASCLPGIWMVHQAFAKTGAEFA